LWSRVVTSANQSGNVIEVRAGTRISIASGLFNCFSGASTGAAFTYAISPLPINATGCTGTVQATIPLAESSLGPATISVSVSGASVGNAISASFTITGILFIVQENGRVVVVTPNREPVPATLALQMVNPDDASKVAPVHGGAISAKGMSIDHAAYFVAATSAATSNQYQSILHVNPLAEETSYRVVATRAYCDDLETNLVVRCADNLSYSPAIVAPAALGTVAIVLGMVKRGHVARKKVVLA
jgi:hypothetical protein